jgi:hypothetical protein
MTLPDTPSRQTNPKTSDRFVEERYPTDQEVSPDGP